MYKWIIWILAITLLGLRDARAQQGDYPITVFPVDSGWASNSVNTVVFRKNSLVSWKDTQYIAFYDKDRYVVLGKRKHGDQQWQLKRTNYQGNAADAHNCISIMVDGAGYLHMAWDHHNNALNYCRSKAPGSLELTDKIPMTGQLEHSVSYPEFYRLPNGDLLFFYRNGESGKGNLIINKYDYQTARWTQLHSDLIDGQGQRSAYWQACVDNQGVIHLSWVWRESPDVASNHDLCYARSEDGGTTWKRSSGEVYRLPITEASAEYACRIPQKRELINQTSMFADRWGHPYIATYWREPGSDVPQYHLVYFNGKKWKIDNLKFRRTAFSLSGAGTKRIPVSRPQVIAWYTKKQTAAALIFRDEERGSKVSVAINTNLRKKRWKLTDLDQESVGSWEPTYDTELWKERGVLDLFVQRVEQVDAEGRAYVPPQMVKVMEWRVVSSQ